jgi:hypothetical protein
MALNQSYHQLWFISSVQADSGHRWKGCLKLVPGQAIPAEIEAVCEARGVDPLSLITQCAGDYKDLRNPSYPAGTKFHLNAKLNDRVGGGLFLSSPHLKQPLEIVKPS